MPVNDERREKVLKGVKTIPLKNLVNLITQGVVSASEIMQRLDELHDEERKTNLAKQLEGFDHSQWNAAQANKTVESYNKYLAGFPNGLHAEECRKALSELQSELLQKQAKADEDAWAKAVQKNTKESMEEYLSGFPNGAHRAECESMLRDLPWLEAKRRNTIDAYQEYARNYPGQHYHEVQQAINALNDDNDWRKAELSDTMAGFEYYIQLHPDGKYVVQAQMAISSRIDRERIVGEIAGNRNAYQPAELQREVENHVISWHDLQSVYTPDEISAIREFKSVTPLPDGEAPEKLQRDTTEVYFWGTPSSGKTCALGAILSASFKYGILTKRPCQGRQYMDRLCNIFINDGICILPQGTPDYSIQEMVFTLRDNKQNEHPLACIDLAGEVFRALYRKQNGIVEENYTQEQALKSTLSYLSDSHNRKIHFFIIAYGEENKEWDGLRMHDYLESTMDYLRDNKIIRKGTNGIYILVTKCDLMPCHPDDRQEYAIKYVQQYMPALCNSLAQICKTSGVQDFDVLPFSLGDVFAQKICRFESDNTDSVLNKLILKSGYIHKGIWGFLNA